MFICQNNYLKKKYKEIYIKILVYWVVLFQSTKHFRKIVNKLKLITIFPKNFMFYIQRVITTYFNPKNPIKHPPNKKEQRKASPEIGKIVLNLTPWIVNQKKGVPRMRTLFLK